ncbi:plasmid partitioning protein RepB [Arboricoccus pini]|uniref:Plasmid partitioning protein RepB n=1 Tax=Arboricoccus pini TaxID=1963835 RepID=A0A212RV69_9PROT|nr:ParB/RepB/Spo0J family partition protein [Arboricoccus pini]SNB76612.1 plasmid partitioning protein RepB [Arboricoccus pini]
MTKPKRPKDLRAGLASIYGGTPRAPSEDPAPRREVGVIASGGAPGVFLREQRQNLVEENATLRSELSQLRQDGGADLLLDPAVIGDRFPSDRTRHAFADEAFVALRESIRLNGQDQPILVRPHPSESGRYEIAYGRRRREACRQLGLQIKARVKVLDDAELLRVMVRENQEREQLSLYERGAFVRQLAMAEKLSVRALAETLGISAGYVSRLMRLPLFSPALEELIGDPRGFSMRLLEELAQVLGGPAAEERVLSAWGSVRPASSPDGRARQVLALLRPAAEDDDRRTRKVLVRRGGKPLAWRRERADGGVSIDFAASLAPAEIDGVVAALHKALGV